MSGAPARLNPFAASRIEALEYRFSDGLGWPALMRRLEALGFRAALVGPEGRGKTTLLEQVASRLEARGAVLRRLTLGRGQRRLSSAERRRLLGDLGPREVLLIDGAQELDRRVWSRIRRRSRSAGGLVITSHQEGLLPTLRLCETSPELLQDLVAELLDELGPGATDLRSLRLSSLYGRHGGNLRSALWELYDRWAER